MANIPLKAELAKALNEAGVTHHEYEKNVLKGLRDEQWAGFYAAYVLGSLGAFVSSCELTKLLEKAPSSETWSNSASEYVLSNLSKQNVSG